MKILKKITFLPLILLPIIYILTLYFSIPSEIVLAQNSEYSIKVNYPCSIACTDNAKAVSVSGRPLAEYSDNEAVLNTSSSGFYEVPVRLFGKLPLKTVSVTVAPEKYLIPSGDTIGIKLYTDGLLVVSVSEFPSDGGDVSPAKEAGLKKGDRITKINALPITSSEDFSRKINSLPHPVSLTVIRDTESLSLDLYPQKSTSDGMYKLGAWVRDSTAGIGTLTYYDPSDSSFASLGHGICDTDTGEIMKVRQGNIISCEILSITKGESGTPGEITGGFTSAELGTISDNNGFGVYGTVKNTETIELSKPLPIGTRFEVKEGEASILADVDGMGVTEYNIEILNVSKSAKKDNKGIVLKITDQKLLDKTGGIVQGMSGSPIIQNGKLVGAVTHVFVNDPTRGYGIFIENMLSETEKIK